MRQPKDYSRLILMVLIFLSSLLSVPKTYQLDPLLGQLLNQQEMIFFLNNRSFFILLAILLEGLGTILNIYILKYLYHFAKLKISLIQNANIYLLVSCLNKVVSLLTPKIIFVKLPFIQTMTFSIIFLLYHAFFQKEKSKRQWSILFIYPLMSLLFGIL